CRFFLSLYRAGTGGANQSAVARARLRSGAVTGTIADHRASERTSPGADQGMVPEPCALRDAVSARRGRYALGDARWCYAGACTATSRVYRLGGRPAADAGMDRGRLG